MLTSNRKYSHREIARRQSAVYLLYFIQHPEEKPHKAPFKQQTEAFKKAYAIAKSMKPGDNLHQYRGFKKEIEQALKEREQQKQIELFNN